MKNAYLVELSRHDWECECHDYEGVFFDKERAEKMAHFIEKDAEFWFNEYCLNCGNDCDYAVIVREITVYGCE